MTGNPSDQAAALQHGEFPAPLAGPPAAALNKSGPYEEYDIRIARDGTWFYHGSPIARKPLVRLFSTVLRRDSDGGFWLITPAERGRIRVEDAPFVAVELSVSGAGREQVLAFRTNVDDMVVAGPDHHIRVMIDPATAAPRPYIEVRNGLEALINRAVFYQLVDLGTEDAVDGQSPQFGVWSGGRFFALGQCE